MPADKPRPAIAQFMPWFDYPIHPFPGNANSLQTLLQSVYLTSEILSLPVLQTRFDVIKSFNTMLVIVCGKLQGWQIGRSK